MAEPTLQKVAYLIGAGATHAELVNVDPYLRGELDGLLTSQVSARVINRARKDALYIENIGAVSGITGTPSIELLITLIESSKVDAWEGKTHYLKTLVQEDITRVLTAARRKRFYLHKALLQLHQNAAARRSERLLGFLSLNYDNVLDNAYLRVLGAKPNYCLSLSENNLAKSLPPLLKLHGSFNWNEIAIHGRKRAVGIIPLGSNKTYSHVPYNFIWNRALELLVECDTLRVIGSSLSQNDFHLIDLIFKAHIERNECINIEVIACDSVGETVKSTYGFLPGIKRLTEIEGNLIPELNPGNPFKTWLKYKILRVLGKKHVHNELFQKVTA
jgi:hypothetical protein